MARYGKVILNSMINPVATASPKRMLTTDSSPIVHRIPPRRKVDSFSFVVFNSAISSPKQVPGVFQITPREDVECSEILKRTTQIDRFW